MTIKLFRPFLRLVQNLKLSVQGKLVAGFMTVMLLFIGMASLAIISLISLIEFKRSTFTLPCAEGKARFMLLYLILSALSTPKFWQKTVELIEENNAAIKKYLFITVQESLFW